MTNSLATNAAVAAMTVDAAPALLPCKVEAAAPEAKRVAKRARKEPEAAAATAAAAPVEAAAAKAAGKRRGKGSAEASSSGPDGATEAPAIPTAAPAVEEGEVAAGSALVVAKAVRTLLKNHPTPMHCGGDALPALNSKVSDIIFEAMGRALANGRKTLKSSDF
jgi:hypothetical protein